VPEIDSATFRQVLGHFPTGVTVITSPGDEPTGMTVGSFFSISLDPPLVGFCAGKDSVSWPAIREAGAFCVNVLAEDQEHISRNFASKEPDKFRGIGWEPTPGTGSPKLLDVLASIDCTIEHVHDAGDHEIAVGRVLALEVEREAGPLVFFRGGYGKFAI